jgi:Leucine-rich repeat (LRR) protein
MDLPSRIDKKGKRAVLTGMELVAVPQLTAMGFDKITELILTRNRLKSLASLGSLPNVKTLDVSFNMLKSVTAAELPAQV